MRRGYAAQKREFLYYQDRLTRSDASSCSNRQSEAVVGLVFLFNTMWSRHGASMLLMEGTSFAPDSSQGLLGQVTYAPGHQPAVHIKRHLCLVP